MKFITYKQNGAPRLGAVTERGVADLTALGFPADLNGVLAGGEELLAKIKDALASGCPVLEREPDTFANVVSGRPKLVCVGLNYKSHAEETGGTAPERPVLFSKFSDCLHPAGEPVELPAWQRCYDYEAELVIVIGKPCYHVTRDEAKEVIFGYTLGNDLSARDCQFLSNQWLTGKSFPGFAPTGPYIVTRDEFDPTQRHAVQSVLNGTLCQNGTTDDMIFSCDEIVENASRYFALEPGDLIYTGTPAGVILGHPKGHRVWMKKGDTVTVRIEGIGSLTTPLI